MKTILASALALGLMTSAALAAPVKLTTAQMDGVKAGSHGVNIATGCVASVGAGLILGIGSSACTAAAN